MTKNIFVDVFIFSAIAHLQKAPITASLEKMPDFPLMSKKIINFSDKMFQVLIFEEIHITEYYLIKFVVKYLEPRKELTGVQYLRGPNPCRNVALM